MSEQTNKKPQFPTQMMLMIRAFIGAYVVYLGVDVLKTENWADPNMLAVVGAGLLLINGAIILYFTIRSFMRDEYEGGKADVGDEDGDGNISWIEKRMMEEEREKE